ncbi:hypothetical protein [Egicoccus sp. AB-alg6-2]|uniref:hypothetical protein n=1 Tax=Egicoccus sp. AB-alg6-2 TaxID=3242692 RepID=UPI00359CD3D5
MMRRRGRVGQPRVFATLTAIVGNRRRGRWPSTGEDRAVATSTAAAIDALDRLQHLRVELGAPWPQLVVGPAGVSIVDVHAHRGPVRLTNSGLHGESGLFCGPCEDARRVARAARRLLWDVEGGGDVPVRVLAVVPPGTRVARDPGVGDLVDAVPADRLADRLVRGPVLPMALVDRAFTRLSVLSGTAAVPAP